MFGLIFKVIKLSLNVLQSQVCLKSNYKKRLITKAMLRFLWFLGFYQFDFIWFGQNTKNTFASFFLKDESLTHTH